MLPALWVMPFARISLLPSIYHANLFPNPSISQILWTYQPSWQPTKDIWQKKSLRSMLLLSFPNCRFLKVSLERRQFWIGSTVPAPNSPHPNNNNKSLPSKPSNWMQKQDCCCCCCCLCYASYEQQQATTWRDRSMPTLR